MVGLFAKAIAAKGTDKFRGVQVALGDIIAWRNLVRAMTTAMALVPRPGPGGSVIPKLEYANALRLFATLSWPKVKEIFENFLGGSSLVTPSSYKDLKDPDLGPLIDKYYRGSESSAEDRIKLFKLIWDAIGTEFGGRHELYEHNYSGNHEQVRLDMVKFAGIRGITQGATDLVNQCLSDYGLDGWTSDTWSFEDGKDE